MNKDCIFCKIISKQIQSKIRYEDDQVLAFDDISPSAPIHILIIPKKHFSTIDEINIEDEKLLGHMIYVAKNLAKENNLSNGYKLVFNTGKDAGQIVYHIHLHLLGGKDLKTIG